MVGAELVGRIRRMTNMSRGGRNESEKRKENLDDEQRERK